MSSSVGVVHINISYNVNENKSSDRHSDVKNMDTKAPIDGHSYLVVHQSHEKWEHFYPFLFFTSSKNGWLCIVCSEYGEGDEFGEQKVLSKGNILTAYSLHIRNPKNAQGLS